MILLLTLVVSVQALQGTPLHRRLDDGLALTPQMGWNSYNQYGCTPSESIITSNADALVSTGLADLGYRYVTTDCGWTVADRLPNGTLTWNETLFPSGFPALGKYLHDRDLLFGVYQDSGIKLCGSPPDQVGSLYYESIDAQTFAEWGVDSLKYDNCYSDINTGYPNVNYAPSVSPSPRYANMSSYLQSLDRPILFQVCEWGIDFPALWAPGLAHSWRIGNDIIPAWRAIPRTLNQAAVQTGFAAPGSWPDLDMLLVGLGVLSTPEEETHFSLWGVLKSPLVIGGDVAKMPAASLGVLSNEDVIGFNQDGLGESASLRRRWSDEGKEVWAGGLSGGRTVAALINWSEEDREMTLDLPDVGVQYAGSLRDVWLDRESTGVKTAYTATVKGHGTMLVELGDTVPVGVYPASLFGETNQETTVFNSIYAQTSSTTHHLTITFTQPPSTATTLTITSPFETKSILLPASQTTVSLPISLTAGATNNTLTIHHPGLLTPPSLTLSPPDSTYHAATGFTLSKSANIQTCGSGFCLPVGEKVGYLGAGGTATLSITTNTTLSGESNTQKYVSIDYINNEIAFSTSWGWGSNSRNLTVQVNGGSPVRLEVPLSGRHSELFGPGQGWWDTATLGVLLPGWVEGENELVFGNVGGEGGFQPLGPDLVGVRVY